MENNVSFNYVQAPSVYINTPSPQAYYQPTQCADSGYLYTMLQMQAENQDLRGKLQDKLLREEEMQQLIMLNGQRYFGMTRSGRWVQITEFIFKTVTILTFDPLYGKESILLIELSCGISSGTFSMSDFLSDKKWLAFLVRLSRTHISSHTSDKRVAALLRSCALQIADREYFHFLGGWTLTDEKAQYKVFEGFRTAAQTDCLDCSKNVAAAYPANAKAEIERFVAHMFGILNRRLRSFVTLWMHSAFLSSLLAESGITTSKMPVFSDQGATVQAYLKHLFSLGRNKSLSLCADPDSFIFSLVRSKDQPMVLENTTSCRNSIDNFNILRHALSCGHMNVKRGKQSLTVPLRTMPIFLSTSGAHLLGTDFTIPIPTSPDDFDFSVCAEIAAGSDDPTTYWSAFATYVSDHLSEFAPRLSRSMQTALTESNQYDFTSDHATVLGVLGCVAEILSEFCGEFSIPPEELIANDWRSYVAAILEESAAEYEAPDGLSDIFLDTARNMISTRRLSSHLIGTCLMNNAAGVVLFDQSRVCLDKAAFQMICDEIGCNPSAVKRELRDKGLLQGKAINANSYETRIQVRNHDGKPRLLRAYQFARNSLETLGEPSLFMEGA